MFFWSHPFDWIVCVLFSSLWCLISSFFFYSLQASNNLLVWPPWRAVLPAFLHYSSVFSVKFVLLLPDNVKLECASYRCAVDVTYLRVSAEKCSGQPQIGKHIALINYWLCSAQKLRLPLKPQCPFIRANFADRVSHTEVCALCETNACGSFPHPL